MSNYRKIWSDHYGPIPFDEKGITYDIHHIDGNRKNNDITNLIAVSIKEHFEIHFKQGDFEACSAIKLRMDDFNFKGYERSEEVKQKISKFQKERKRNPLSEETKRKIGESRKGKKHTDETRNKLSKFHKGKKLSEESRKKLSEYKKGKRLSDEHKRKVSESLKGRKVTEETKMKLSKKQKGIREQKLECPHCKLVGGATNMKRYHFDNCNKKSQDIYLK